MFVPVAPDARRIHSIHSAGWPRPGRAMTCS